MHNKKVIYACDEHIEIALDDFINQYEEAPETFLVDDKKCSYCDKIAKYEINFFEKQ